jgi:hypothetical protein
MEEVNGKRRESFNLVGSASGSSNGQARGLAVLTV